MQNCSYNQYSFIVYINNTGFIVQLTIVFLSFIYVKSCYISLIENHTHIRFLAYIWYKMHIVLKL